eukprot:3599444-Rhodomonas_salina.4
MSFTHAVRRHMAKTQQITSSSLFKTARTPTQQYTKIGLMVQPRLKCQHNEGEISDRPARPAELQEHSSSPTQCPTTHPRNILQPYSLLQAPTRGHCNQNQNEKHETANVARTKSSTTQPKTTPTLAHTPIEHSENHQNTMATELIQYGRAPRPQTPNEHSQDHSPLEKRLLQKEAEERSIEDGPSDEWVVYRQGQAMAFAEDEDNSVV